MSRAQGSGAAALVPLLLAFLKEPARERPRYTSGREAIDGGDHVVRFAQGRFPPHVMAKTSPAERDRLREAALAFIRQVCLWDDATHYQVLCVRPGARREEVKENYHLLMGLIHPDRRDSDSVAWPQDAPQRVNHAYATLMDEERRREYDATLDRMRASHHPPAASAAPARIRAARGRWRRGIAAAALVLAVVSIALLTMEMPGGDDERESRLLGRWSMARSADPADSSRSPRFMNRPTRSVAPDVAADRKAPVEVPVLAPLLRALLPGHAPREDRRVGMEANAAIPQSQPPAAEPAAEVRPAAPPIEPLVVEPLPAAPPKPIPTPRMELAQAAPAAAPVPAAPNPVAAPQRVPSPPSGPHLTSRDIESTVVRLIDSYEAGRVDDLMALVDSSGWGLWATMGMRNSYTQFFRSTRERHLHVATLDWQANGTSAMAHGKAQLHAEYTDERGTFDGPVSLDLEIALRDGQPRIIQLKLFPSPS